MSNAVTAMPKERNDIAMVRKMHSQIIGEVKTSHNRVENNMREMFNDLKREWQKIQKENLDLRSKNQQLQKTNNNLTKKIAEMEKERSMILAHHRNELELCFWESNYRSAASCEKESKAENPGFLSWLYGWIKSGIRIWLIAMLTAVIIEGDLKRQNILCPL